MPRKPKGFDTFDKLTRLLVQVPKSELSTKTPPKKKPRKRKR
jgi:hypothetical protein